MGHLGPIGPPGAAPDARAAAAFELAIGEANCPLPIYNVGVPRVPQVLEYARRGDVVIAIHPAS